MRDYDEQRRAGIAQPVFDASKFSDLDLDPQAWPVKPVAEAEAEVAVGQAQTQR
ncbi:hypothetical protein D3C85_1905410 [compost metagenome]